MGHGPLVILRRNGAKVSFNDQMGVSMKQS